MNKDLDDIRDRKRTRYLRDVMNIPINDIGGQSKIVTSGSPINDDDLTSPDAPSPDVNNSSNKNNNGVNDGGNNDNYDIDVDEEAENWMMESQLATNNREYQRWRISEEEEEEYFDEYYENIKTQSSNDSTTTSQDPFNNDDLFDGYDDEFKKMMA
jgi:hypothetical protein